MRKERCITIDVALTLLQAEKEGHVYSYGLNKSQAINSSSASLFLTRLEERGLLKSKKVLTEHTFRRLFSLTAKGKKEVQQIKEKFGAYM